MDRTKTVAGTVQRRLILPSADLRSLVRRYCVARVPLEGELQAPAYKMSMLVVMFGEASVVAAEERTFLPGSALLTGPQTRPYVLAGTGHQLGFFGIEFTPTGLWSLFGDVVGALRDNLLPLADVVPARALRDLAGALTEAPDDGTRVARVEAFLRSLALTRTRAFLRQARQFELLVRQDPARRVADIATEMGISTALLRRSVARVTGTSPKAWAESLRLGACLGDLLADPRVSTTWVAHQHGYHDASHFHRSFRRFAGVSPAAVSRTRFGIAAALL